MAVLHSRSGGVALLFRPYGVADRGDPVWLLVQLEFRGASSSLMATTISVTEDDVRRLVYALADVIAGRNDRVTVTTTDDDFVLDVTGDATLGVATVGFWAGEPAVLMRGYRFMASLHELEAFRIQVEADSWAATTENAWP